jgi:glyoxylase-like metal-dependent hydrolase (beta-lactamase superfamily II)
VTPFSINIAGGPFLEKIKDIIIIEGINFDSNVYIFNDVIVDTGTGENMDYIFRSLNSAGIDVDDLSLIINTHNHYDHVGGNRFLDLPVAMHREDALPLEKGDEVATASLIFGKPLGKMKVNRKLEAGDNIGPFQVIHTPGHTKGGICLYDGETLISGDTVFAGGGFGRYDLGGDLLELTQSIYKLTELDFDILLPGHGPWTDHGPDHVKMAYDIIKSF